MPGKRYLPLAIGLASVIASVYLLEWILSYWFQNTAKDAVAVALKPFQNHYFSVSSHFVTTEGLANEFSNDTTAAGRTFAFLIPAIVVWVVMAVLLYLIKPLRKKYSVIIMAVALMIMAIAVYSAFFVPPRKVSFSEKEMVVEDARWMVLRKSVLISHDAIDRFEYDYYRTTRGYLVSNLLYSRIYAVLGSKRYLVGENQLQPDDGKAGPNEVQEMEARRAVDILNKIAGKEAAK